MIIANFKSNGSEQMIVRWVQDFISNIDNNHTTLGIAPPYTYIEKLERLLSDANQNNLKVGAQDVGVGSGAKTGSVSSSMLADLNCNFAIIGHSERRAIFNESNELIREKVKNLISSKLTPVLCVGESYSDFENKKTLITIKEQLYECLSDIHIPQDIIIAYEPLWAIGSGKTPNPTDVNEINEYIKDVVQSATSNNYVPSVCYGGSVDVENAGSFFDCSYIDGALVGGASLDGKKFALIANEFNRNN